MNSHSMRRAHRPLAMAVAVALGIGSAHAANITVLDIGDTGSASTCTLRQAIESANNDDATGSTCAAGAGADVIGFDGTLASSTITLANGELSVADGTTLTINGSGQTIDANGTSRVLHVGRYASLTASSLTVTGGRSPDSGGAIYAEAYANLSLSDLVVSNSSSGDQGGGIYLDIHGSLTLLNSTVDGNSCASWGGGLALEGYTDTSLTGSTITNNIGAEDAGGVYVAEYSQLTAASIVVTGNSTDGQGAGLQFFDSQASIATSAITGNEAGGYGGGLYADDTTVIVSDSTISGNTAYSGAGAYLTGATSTVSDSTISGNIGFANAGGIYASDTDLTVTGSSLNNNLLSTYENYGGGALYGSSSSVSIRDTTVADNTVTGDTSGYFAGGLYFWDSTATLVNVTIAGNHASGDDQIAGGAIQSQDDLASGEFLRLINVTVSGNTAEATAAAAEDAAGGILVGPYATGLVELQNSVVSRNVGTITNDIGIANDGGVVTAYHSLLGTALATTQTGNGNLFSDAPGLGGLAENGGPTLTMALLSGSPALDAGDNALVPGGVTTDQRGAGYVRIFNGTVDIGAFEVQAAAPPPASTSVPVPVRSPWALGLLAVLLGFAGLRRRRRRT
ncbi:MAG TPA: right-handed parallel beta-helix repeat-containing protein [Rhodanobacteraceae bacterium]|nr:right-handed parallel beta-helix repeat-containing protein [Rhodanobacteraceae bacterium]